MKLKEYFEKKSLWEMANVTQKKTGLPMMIWVDIKTKRKHIPRIKVSKTHAYKMVTDDLVSVSIEDNPKILAGTGLKAKDFEIVKSFIKQNKELLLKYWNKEIIEREDLENKIKKIK